MIKVIPCLLLLSFLIITSQKCLIKKFKVSQNKQYHEPLNDGQFTINKGECQMLIEIDNKIMYMIHFKNCKIYLNSISGAF